jgi:hypothetical protein
MMFASPIQFSAERLADEALHSKRLAAYGVSLDPAAVRATAERFKASKESSKIKAKKAKQAAKDAAAITTLEEAEAKKNATSDPAADIEALFDETHGPNTWHFGAELVAALDYNEDEEAATGKLNKLFKREAKRAEAKEKKTRMSKKKQEEERKKKARDRKRKWRAAQPEADRLERLEDRRVRDKKNYAMDKLYIEHGRVEFKKLLEAADTEEKIREAKRAWEVLDEIMNRKR